jgi:hypothetical protein
VADNYDDEELRDTFINISLDLYVTSMLTPLMSRLTIDADAVFLNNQ